MNIKPIKTKKDYEAALARMYELMQKNLKANSKQSDELEVLSILVEAYENEHYSIPPPHPIEAIIKKKTNALVDPKVGNYEKHPFFIKKSNEANA